MEKKKQLGMIHVYTGNGKGKTTSSLGLALRALGHGYSVCIVQFMKGGRYFGELAAAEKFLPQLKFAQFGQGCPYADRIREGEMTCGACRDCFVPFEEEVEQSERALRYASRAAKSGDYDIVILDEVNVAISKKHIAAKSVLELMLTKSPSTELILTGRGAPSEIVAAADYATEMRELKHPFNKNKRLFGRRGVEY